MMEELLLALIKEGNLSLPSLLLKQYKEIGLTDQEMMLIIHTIQFKQEGKDFPSIQEWTERMTSDEVQVIAMLQKLVQKGYLAIEDTIEKETGMRAEIIRLDPLYQKLAALFAAKHAAVSATDQNPKKSEGQNLYTVFENEFGRPLSPIECETLGMWQDQDSYSDELIIAALREAVISNKLFFRYIDRILYEWQRNNIRTPQQAREFSLKFRKPPQSAPPKKAESFPFYNWLENDS